MYQKKKKTADKFIISSLIYNQPNLSSNITLSFLISS